MQVSPHTARALGKARNAPGSVASMVSKYRPLYTSNAPPSRYAPAVGRLPRRAIPLFVTTEGAPAGCPAVVCFPSAYRFIKHSCDQAPNGRRAFGQAIEPIHSITGSIRFPSSRPTPQQRPHGLPAPDRRTLPCPTQVPPLGLTRTPVAQHLRWRMLDPPSLATYLLVQAYQHLWPVRDDGAAVIHMC